MFNPKTKFEVSTIACYKNMKGNAKSRNCGGLGLVWVTQGHRQCRHLIEHIRLGFLIDFNRNYCFSSYLSKVANFNLPHLHLAPQLGGNPV